MQGLKEVKVQSKYFVTTEDKKDSRQRGGYQDDPGDIAYILGTTSYNVTQLAECLAIVLGSRFGLPTPHKPGCGDRRLDSQ